MLEELAGEHGARLIRILEPDNITDGLPTGELGAMLEELEVSTTARLADAEGELRFWLKELDPDADRRITRAEFAAALGRRAVLGFIGFKDPDSEILSSCFMQIVAP